MADDPKRHKKSKKKHRKESKHGRDIPMEKMPKKVRCDAAADADSFCKEMKDSLADSDSDSFDPPANKARQDDRDGESDSEITTSQVRR